MKRILLLLVTTITICPCSCSNKGNVIKACCNLPRGTRIINVGYAGSNNLSVDAFLNNAMRESGVLTDDEVWANVRQTVETLLSRK